MVPAPSSGGQIWCGPTLVVPCPARYRPAAETAAQRPACPVTTSGWPRQQHYLAHRAPRVHPVVRAHVTDPRPEAEHVHPAETLPEKIHLPARRVGLGRHDLQQRALAGPVRPEQSPVLARPDRQAHLIQDQPVAADQVDAAGLDDDAGVGAAGGGCHGPRSNPAASSSHSGRLASSPAGRPLAGDLAGGLRLEDGQFLTEAVQRVSLISVRPDAG
jgi:hypothetical protein